MKQEIEIYKELVRTLEYLKDHPGASFEMEYLKDHPGASFETMWDTKLLVLKWVLDLPEKVEDKK